MYYQNAKLKIPEALKDDEQMIWPVEGLELKPATIKVLMHENIDFIGQLLALKPTKNNEKFFGLHTPEIGSAEIGEIAKELQDRGYDYNIIDLPQRLKPGAFNKEKTAAKILKFTSDLQDQFVKANEQIMHIQSGFQNLADQHKKILENLDPVISKEIKQSFNAHTKIEQLAKNEFVFFPNLNKEELQTTGIKQISDDRLHNKYMIRIELAQIFEIF